MSTDQTTFKKDDKEKTRYRLVHPLFLKGVAEVLTYGGNHYGDDTNWKKCPDPWRYYDPLWRHVMAFLEGESEDPDTGKHHLFHATCCILFMWWMDVFGNKRPKLDTEPIQETIQDGLIGGP